MSSSPPGAEDSTAHEDAYSSTSTESLPRFVVAETPPRPVPSSDDYDDIHATGSSSPIRASHARLESRTARLRTEEARLRSERARLCTELAARAERAALASEALRAAQQAAAGGKPRGWRAAVERVLTWVLRLGLLLLAAYAAFLWLFWPEIVYARKMRYESLGLAVVWG